MQSITRPTNDLNWLLEMENFLKESTSLSSMVKALLMKAWRERWTDVQWGTQVKRIFSSKPEEQCDLAELLFEQALVGTSPNNLVLSYLRHAVSTQLIPLPVALKHITQFDDLTRPYCILSLIESLEVFCTRLSYCSRKDMGLNICRGLQKSIHWLLICIQNCLQKDRLQQEHILMVENACSAIIKIVDNDANRALLYIASYDDTEAFRELDQTEVNVRGMFGKIHPNTLPSSTREKICDASNAYARIADMNLPCGAVLEVKHLPICPTVNCLVSIEAILNMTSDTQPFIDQVLLIEKLMKLERRTVFCELLRACFMGMVDSAGGSEELKWVAFTFLKLPQVLKKFEQLTQGNGFMQQLENGVDVLLNMISLLDLTDIKMFCDCIEVLLRVFLENGLIDEDCKTRLHTRRTNETEKGKSVEPVNQPNVQLILRAESTINNIMKALDADYSKNQEPLAGVLNHMLSVKSFELILAAAAATGKLQSFVLKLIKLNEFAKHGGVGENEKTAQTRALLFDISYLMLCHISQLYGTEIMTATPECGDTFFVQWATKCLPEDGRCKSPDNWPVTDQSKVDNLLHQIYTTGDIKNSSTQWSDVCLYIPFTVQQVFYAWECGSLSDESVTNFVNNIKGRLCCLPVAIAAWLCSYIMTVGEERRTKPRTILKHLLTTGPPTTTSQYYTERSNFMNTVLRRMVNDILPSATKSSTQYVALNVLPSQTAKTTLRDCFNKGWLDIKSLRTCEHLLNLCGSEWFCYRIVEIMLESMRTEDLCQTLGLAFPLFQMDLEQLTLNLLLETIPSFLLSDSKQNHLVDPRGYTLAKLGVMCIIATEISRSSQKDSELPVTFRRKRTRKEMELEDMDDVENRPQKIRKTQLSEPQLTLSAEGFNLDMMADVKDECENGPFYDVKEPLNKAIVSLFDLMNEIIHDTNLSPRTGFIISFIEEAVGCGRPHSRFILQFMPNNMLSQMLRSLPGVFSDKQILHICDLHSSQGRKIAARTVCETSKQIAIS